MIDHDQNLVDWAVPDRSDHSRSIGPDGERLVSREVRPRPERLVFVPTVSYQECDQQIRRNLLRSTSPPEYFRSQSAHRPVEMLRLSRQSPLQKSGRFPLRKLTPATWCRFFSSKSDPLDLRSIFDRSKTGRPIVFTCRRSSRLLVSRRVIFKYVARTGNSGANASELTRIPSGIVRFPASRQTVHRPASRASAGS